MGLDWFSQKLWQLSFLFWEKQESVLHELGWAGLQTLVCHSHAPEGGLESQDIVASVTSQALKHLHRDFTGQEKLRLHLESMNLRALLLTSSDRWLPSRSGGSRLVAVVQLGSLGISTPAINKLNWMFEAFIIWHHGAPSGFICLLQKQKIWPHAALSHETVLLPLTLARPRHT